eukprot:GILJ01004137.1.p1 GENE.GILJ01004137.1~~GILJ01004137.1.p1  ORF type:complete len:325 (+),score=22.82 GILJ01004137.1:142-1116(+)
MTWLTCGDASWFCIRYFVMGAVSLVTLAFCLYAFFQVVRNRQLAHSSVSAVMFLACLQTAISVVYYLFWNTNQVLYMLRTARLLQDILICFLFCQVVVDQAHNKKLRFSFITLLLYVVILLAVSSGHVAFDEFECQDISWLLFSVSTFVITLAFLILGGRALRRLEQVEHTRTRYTNLVSGQQELALKKKQLWILMVIDFIASSLQLLWDSVLLVSLGSAGGCKQFMQTVPLIQTVIHIIIRIFTVHFPIWAVLYAFYWVHRHQYQSLNHQWDVRLESLDMDDGIDFDVPSAVEMSTMLPADSPPDSPRTPPHEIRVKSVSMHH